MAAAPGGTAAATAAALMALDDAFKAAHQALLKTWGNSTANEEQEQDKKTLNQQISLLKNGNKTSSGFSAGLQVRTCIFPTPSAAALIFLPLSLITDVDPARHSILQTHNLLL